MWGWAVWSIVKARSVLGYRPRYGFADFLEAWRRGDESHYPFAESPRWGV